jgi:hypothetical protein
MRASAARAAAEAPGPTVEEAQEPPPELVQGTAVRLTSGRACLETNLARKGIWRPGAVRSTGGGEIVRLLDATDQLGLVQRIDAGPPLGALAFDVIVWICSRWRQQPDGRERRIPFTLEALIEDLGREHGGRTNADVAKALDLLKMAAFRARVYDARRAETVIDTFGLLDRWRHGERHRRGRPAQAGYVVLSDWLHEQLVRGHVTYLDWAQLRALRSGTARRLFAYLEAERFPGPRWRRIIDPPLLATLGIEAVRSDHQRATLRRAAAEVTAAANRYESVMIERGAEGRRGHDLVVVRSRPPRGRSIQ